MLCHLFHPSARGVRPKHYYEAEGGVIELETGAPYAPHVKAKIT